MTVPTTVTDAPSAATVNNQARPTSTGELALYESTRYILPGGSPTTSLITMTCLRLVTTQPTSGSSPSVITCIQTHPPSIHTSNLHLHLPTGPRGNLIQTPNFPSGYIMLKKPTATHSLPFYNSFCCHICQMCQLTSKHLLDRQTGFIL